MTRSSPHLGQPSKPGATTSADSPALDVAANLHLRGANVRVYDPKAMNNAAELFPRWTSSNRLPSPARMPTSSATHRVAEFVSLDPHDLATRTAGRRISMLATSWIRTRGAMRAGSIRGIGRQ